MIQKSHVIFIWIIAMAVKKVNQWFIRVTGKLLGPRFKTEDDDIVLGITMMSE